MSGWNWRAVVALVLGMIMAVGGAYSNVVDGVATGPFPEGGILSFLKFELPWGGFLYDYSWIVGLIVSLLVYWVLATLVPEPEQVEAEAPAAAPEAV
jgi:NCS1 family nucleobase:cation symporter-1